MKSYGGLTMYKYETHCHTAPVSKCARATVRETLEFYRSLGYEGVFITNHFLDGNGDVDRSTPYETQINAYFADYEAGVAMTDEIGIKVFLGVEMSYEGTDFLIYGLDKEWYLAHPEIMDMKKSEELPYIMENGGYVVHAHPYREAGYIDHIRLYPREIHGVEVLNSSRTDFENHMAELYAENYGFTRTAGSDNHHGPMHTKNIAGMMSDTPIADEADFVERVKNGTMEIFKLENKTPGKPFAV